MPSRSKANTANNKIDDLQQFRPEIEQRTAHGETCEQIAAALRAKGLDITNKTVSRRRVEWGLRKRPFSKTGTANRVSKARTDDRLADPSNPRSRKLRGARKADIEARTNRGETAEQIAEALMAQGVELKKGASTILRLQTTWNLIPHDIDRARGRKRKADKSSAVSPRSAKALKREQREMEREANKQQQSQTLHYPTNCSFGPKKRVNGATLPVDDDDAAAAAADGGAYDDSLPPPNGQLDHAHQSEHPSVGVATEVMSVEFLVDLANSTLVAATNLKDMLLAYQAQRPAPSLASAFPPTLQDLSTARRKVREAAAVMHDLAVEPDSSAS